MTGTTNTAGTVEGYQALDQNSEVFLQKRTLVAESPDKQYQVLAGKKYHNLLLYDTRADQAVLLKRKAPYAMGNKIVFVDSHTFCVDNGDMVDFYNARTGEHVDFLEMQFGYQEGQKTLLGFTYDRAGSNFAALYVNEGPIKAWWQKYWAALFNREGKLLDHFRTDINLIQSWGKIVVPRLTLEGDCLTVAAKKFPADYILTFHGHTTESQDKEIL